MAGQGGQKKVTGMEKIVTKPGQAPVAHFVTGLDECEKKTVVWEVRNLSELMGMSTEDLQKNGITFDAGHSIGIPATWNLYFTRIEHLNRTATWRLYFDGAVGGVGYISNFLRLSPDSKAKLVMASYSISLSCGDEVIFSDDLDPYEFKTPEILPREGRRPLQWILLRESDLLQKTENGQKALKVTLTLKVFSNKDSVKTPKGNLLKAEDLTSDLGKMLETGDGADVEISVPKEIGGNVDASSYYTRKVHKTILMSRSTVFSKMFAKESGMVEAKTGKVVIKDLSPKGLDIFLRYLYTEKVSDEWLQLPEEILNCAEKYDLGRLKQYCGRNLMSAVSTSNALEMFQVAKLHKLSFAKRAITEFISRNTKAVLNSGDFDGDEDTSGEESDTE